MTSGGLWDWLGREESQVDLSQEGGPLLGPESGLLSHTRQGIVQGDTRADKERDFRGKADSRRAREPRRAALPWGLRSLVLGEGIGFWVAFGQPFRLGVLPGGHI